MGRYADKFVYKLINAGVGINKLNASLNKFIDENSEVLQKVMSGREISVSVFLELYDKRIYDIHSKQNDIKYMKELDFKGLYLIKNQTKKKYYLGRGDKVFKKVDRHFKGYGNQEIFSDFSKKDKFIVAFGKLDDSGYDNLDDFEKEIKSSLKSKLEGYLYYDVISAKNTRETNTKINSTKKVDVELVSNVAKNNARELKKKRWKAFWFDKKKIMLDISTTALVGKTYSYVINTIMDNGFINIETVPMKDIYVNSNYTPGEVEQIVIDGKYLCNCGEMIPYDARIIVIFHLKKEFVFPYSSRQVKKQNCMMLEEELRNIGFTEIKMVAIKDLKKGWIVKDGSVENVIVNRQENYKKGIVLDYDAEITISYHTFK